MSSYILEIRGNQEDPLGNPMGYYSTTHRGKWVDPRALKYTAWKRHVVECWLEKFGKYPDFKRNGNYQLNVTCYFKNEIHYDPENVRKGISDSIFHTGDKHVWGSVDFEHGVKKPGVRIEVIE